MIKQNDESIGFDDENQDGGRYWERLTHWVTDKVGQ